MRILPFLFLLIACDGDGMGRNSAGGGAGGGGASSSSSGGGGGGGSLSGDETLYVSGSRIKRRMLEGDDGSVSFVGFFDDELDGPCAYGPDGDGAQRCLPTHRALFQNFQMFADSSCTQELAYQSRTSCGFGPPPTAATRGSCSSLDWWAVGQIHDGSIYVNADGPCELVSRNPSWRYVHVGRKLSLSDFVEAVEFID